MGTITKKSSFGQRDTFELFWERAVGSMRIDNYHIFEKQNSKEMKRRDGSNEFS